MRIRGLLPVPHVGLKRETASMPERSGARLHLLSPAAQADGRERLKAALLGSFDAVWRTLRSLGVSASAADDAAQQVFMVLARRIGDVAPGKERAYLLQTAIRVAANYRRADRRRREVLGRELDAQKSGVADPESLLEQKQRLERLEQLLSKLPSDLRTVFVLFEIEGLSSPEIAGVLELPRGTVASRLRRAREIFSRMVARLGCRTADGGRR